MYRKLVYLASFVLVLGLTTTVANADISDGLVAYWPLNEGEGATTSDVTGNGSNGTINGGPNWVEGKFGGALDFDGSDDYVDCGNLPILDFGTGDWTVSAWINSTNVGSDDPKIYSKGGDSGGGIRYEIYIRHNNNQDAKVLVDDDNDKYDPDTDDHEGLIDGNWHHIVGMRRNGTDLRVYVDGVEDMGVTNHGEATIPANYDLSGTSQANAHIGANWHHEDQAVQKFFRGLIDDVAIWDRALTPDEISYLWNNGDGNPVAVAEKEQASNPSPKNRATVNLPDATPLSWTAGEYAVKHDVYFGTNEADVNDADATDTTGIYRGRQNLPIYTPTEALELGQTYYWRIDEVEDDNTTLHRGSVWSFSIIGYILIDDFEGYKGDEVPVTEQIWGIWRDGLGFGDPAVPPYSPGNGTGSEIGDVDTTSYTEETITHDGSSQSMPYWYNNNKQGFLKYSEAKKTLTDSRDWTEQDVKALSLWFRGYPAAMGGFVEAPAGTYTITAEGTDIWNNSDEFHFAWQQLNGPGTITAKVVSVSNTDPWAKAGVMIRDTLDADSAHAMIAVTPGSGVSFGRRTAAGNASNSDTQAGLTAPYWVRLERTSGGGFRASYSADGGSWTPLGALTSVTMSLPMYVGLALTSHEPGVQCEAVFSNVTSDGTGPWTAQDIGLTNNQAVPMYVAVANNTGAPGVVYHEDANATLVGDWTEWNIDLNDIADKGVDLTDVNSIAIGFGDRDNPVAGGAGKMYFDDIRLYRARYVPDKVTPHTADFTDDGVVDFTDLQIMINDWLMGDYTRPGPLLVHYEFDEGAGTVAGDSSGLGNDGAFSGTATWASDEIGGWAGAFDGGVGEVRNDSVSANLNGLSALSFGAWIKSNAIDTDAGVIIFANPSGNDQRDIRYDSAGSSGGGTNVIKYGVATEEGSHENESAANVQTTQWQHVMVTWTSGEAAKLYINGVLDIPTDEDGIIGGTTSGYTTLIVGRGGKDQSGSWDGLVDDVRVYEVALTAAEVQTVMNGGDVPVVDVYVPLTSVANISDEEPVNSKKVNFKDFAILAEEWLAELLWPEW